MRLAEIGDPVVVNTADLGQQLTVRNTVPKEALAGLQHRAPDTVLLVFFDHRVGVIGTLADILPEPEKIDLRGVLKALPGLHHRAQGADLHAVQHPGVVFPSCRRFSSFHLGRSVAALSIDVAVVVVHRSYYVWSS